MAEESLEQQSNFVPVCPIFAALVTNTIIIQTCMSHGDYKQKMDKVVAKFDRGTDQMID